MCQALNLKTIVHFWQKQSIPVSQMWTMIHMPAKTELVGLLLAAKIELECMCLARCNFHITIKYLTNTSPHHIAHTHSVDTKEVQNVPRQSDLQTETSHTQH